MAEAPRRGGGFLRELAYRYLPPDIRRRGGQRYRQLRSWPPVGLARFGSLRRVTPVSREFGFDRGDPIDRYYIDDFMRRHAGAAGYAPGVVRGRVLEVGEPLYAQRYADRDRLDAIEILDASPTNPQATVVADLRDAPELDSDSFDCVICTQTLLLIYEVRDAVRTLHRILKPGGTLLVTVPGVSQICHPDMESWGDFWRFTSLSARRLFEEFFDPSQVTLETYGNVLTAAAFLYGFAAQDLRRSELDVRDPDYQVLIAVKAVKGPSSLPA
jgi:SAM-dependent methyltransferase